MQKSNTVAPNYGHLVNKTKLETKQLRQVDFNLDKQRTLT